WCSGRTAEPEPGRGARCPLRRSRRGPSPPARRCPGPGRRGPRRTGSPRSTRTPLRPPVPMARRTARPPDGAAHPAGVGRDADRPRGRVPRPRLAARVRLLRLSDGELRAFEIPGRAAAWCHALCCRDRKLRPWLARQSVVAGYWFLTRAIDEKVEAIQSFFAAVGPPEPKE